MSWVSPTGFVDSGGEWMDETNAYDDNTATSASCYDIESEDWTSFLELTHSAIQCDKIRFYAATVNNYVDTVDVDVYYGGAWHDVYQGSWTEDSWVEKSIPGGEQSVTSVRFRFWNSDEEEQDDVRLKEVEFWRITAGNVPAAIHHYKMAGGL